MNFLKKLLNRQSTEDNKVKSQEVTLSLDDLFVHHFIEKGGKFLYCTKQDEVIDHLKNILTENNWNQIRLLEPYLKGLLDPEVITSVTDMTLPVFSSCEFLIADNGNILLTSNQLKSNKIANYSENFIIYATTSQIVKDTGDALTGINTTYKGYLPTNISSIKNYTIKKDDDIFLNYGNNNSKNLYLLLFEDL